MSSFAAGQVPPLLWGTKKKDVEARKALVARFVSEGCTKAEAELRMVVAVFKRHARYVTEVKKIPADRLKTAIDELAVEDVMES